MAVHRMQDVLSMCRSWPWGLWTFVLESYLYISSIYFFVDQFSCFL